MPREEAPADSSSPSEDKTEPEMDDQDPYTSPEEDYDDSSEEEQQESSAEGAAEYYGQLLSAATSSCDSPGQSNPPAVAPTPPAGAMFGLESTTLHQEHAQEWSTSKAEKTACKDNHRDNDHCQEDQKNAKFCT